MTVRELIERLQAYPLDTLVIDDCGPITDEDIEFLEKYYKEVKDVEVDVVRII